MRLSTLFVASSVSLVSAGVLPAPYALDSKLASCLPLDAYKTTEFTPYTLEEAQAGGIPRKPIKLTPYPKYAGATRDVEDVEDVEALEARQATTCTNPRIRQEWDSMPAAGRNAFIDAVRCLIRNPASGQFPQASNRYEDLVALHQTFTPTVHGNSKFLLWHRYYLAVFEDLLRTECGFAGNLPWFDERRYAGRFAQSTLFSATYMGGVNIGGACVTNGRFANLTLTVGPGARNVRHCLARNGNDGRTANTGASMVNACNSRTTFSSMAGCAEGGAHAWGHNGIGAVMSDVYASPGDPVFWLHHAFVDRNFRIWQNANAVRIQTINGNDENGQPLTLNTPLSTNNIRPNRVIRDVINTLGGSLCYRYDY